MIINYRYRAQEEHEAVALNLSQRAADFQINRQLLLKGTDRESRVPLELVETAVKDEEVNKKVELGNKNWVKMRVCRRAIPDLNKRYVIFNLEYN